MPDNVQNSGNFSGDDFSSINEDILKKPARPNVVENQQKQRPNVAANQQQQARPNAAANQQQARPNTAANQQQQARPNAAVNLQQARPNTAVSQQQQARPNAAVNLQQQQHANVAANQQQQPRQNPQNTGTVRGIPVGYNAAGANQPPRTRAVVPHGSQQNNSDATRKITVPPRSDVSDDTPTRTLDKKAVAELTAKKTASTAIDRSATGVMQRTGTSSNTAAVKAAAKKKKRRRDNTLLSVIFAVVYIIFIAVASIFIAAFTISVADDMFALTKVNEDMVEITLPEDATVTEVAEILSENGVIKYPTVFEIRANMKLDEDDYFVAGTHTVSGSMNYDQLRQSLLYYETVEIYTVTIPEGYTTDEIIDLFVSYGIGTREGFEAELALALSNDVDDETGEAVVDSEGAPVLRYNYWFVKELVDNPPSADRFYALDGYLFPDTYDFYSNSTERTVITKLLDNFDYRYQDAWKLRASDLGYTTDEVLILASLIEKEAKYISDFSYVSSVFSNRLKHSSSYPCLESDATIMYAIQHDSGSRLESLTGADTSYNSRYNTYLYAGLTPGPIASPGYNAINYALYPSNTNYYYFVSNNAGKIYYAETQEEQLANISQAREDNAAAAAQ